MRVLVVFRRRGCAPLPENSIARLMTNGGFCRSFLPGGTGGYGTLSPG